MYIESLDLDINKISNYTREDIKALYKKIALECHPDKLCNIKDVNDKNVKIEKFKRASIGYKKALEDFDKYGELVGDYINIDMDSNYTTDDIGEHFKMYKDFAGFGGSFDTSDFEFWSNMYNDYFTDKDAIQKTFIDVAKLFFKKGFKNKDYYNPSMKVIKHDIILPVSYYDLYNTKKKRIQILLKGVEEPFNISILCKKEYPCLKRQYIDDNGIEHEIEIKMMISNTNRYSSDDSEDSEDSDICSDEDTCDDDSNDDKQENPKGLKVKNTKYTHKIRNNIIDLITVIDINLKDYLIGSVKTVKYIDNSYVDILILPFNIENIVIKNKGLMGGDLIIKLILRNILQENWNRIDDDKKNVFTKYIDDMYI